MSTIDTSTRDQFRSFGLSDAQIDALHKAGQLRDERDCTRARLVAAHCLRTKSSRHTVEMIKAGLSLEQAETRLRQLQSEKFGPAAVDRIWRHRRGE